MDENFLRKLIKAHQLCRDSGPLFWKYFTKTIGPFWDTLCGFDILKFDDEIVQSKPDESVLDALVRQYGQDAAEFIGNIISKEVAIFAVE